MKNYYLILIALLLVFQATAQENDLPIGFAPGEREMMRAYIQNLQSGPRDVTSPPDMPLRAMAEWEELQSLVIAWTSYSSVLKQIVAASKDDCEILILCNSNQTQNTAQSYLLANNAGGPPLPNLNNITFLIEDYNSVWMRDYGANTVYGNDVDSLFLVDWIYNRPRPLDDASAVGIADHKGITLVRTIEAPTDLVNTGGNFHVDGRGTAFASELILEENEPGNPYDVTPKSEEDIDQIMADFMGIERYIKMTALQYDNINHIDMHFRFMDEETLLVGEFPVGISDGPQINANIEFVLSNFNSVWGTPYRVHRIPMPNSTAGNYPGGPFGNGYYRTYTNSFFTNNSYVMPLYREEFDTTAFRIIEDLLPGYNIVGIDCDDGNNPIISASGAIHCITKEIGVNHPLLISHQRLRDTDNTINPYELSAMVKHVSGIASVSVFWSLTPGTGYTEVPLTLTDVANNIWSGAIPPQVSGSIVYYYIHAEANSGKTINRPIPAPTAYFPFRVFGITSSLSNEMPFEFTEVFPNPASAITYIGINSISSKSAKIYMHDMQGRVVQLIHDGALNVGENKFFIDASAMSAGMYLIVVENETGNRITKKLVVQ
jgi:agmatine deiminase